MKTTKTTSQYNKMKKKKKNDQTWNKVYKQAHTHTITKTHTHS